MAFDIIIQMDVSCSVQISQNTLYVYIYTYNDVIGLRFGWV